MDFTRRRDLTLFRFIDDGIELDVRVFSCMKIIQCRLK